MKVCSWIYLWIFQVFQCILDFIHHDIRNCHPFKIKVGHTQENFKNLQEANPWHANYAATWSPCTSETCAVQDASRPEMSAVTILYINHKCGSNSYLKVSGVIRSQKLKSGYPKVSGSCNRCKSRAGHWGPNDLWAPLLPRQACHADLLAHRWSIWKPVVFTGIISFRTVQQHFHLCIHHQPPQNDVIAQLALWTWSSHQWLAHLNLNRVVQNVRPVDGWKSRWEEFPKLKHFRSRCGYLHLYICIYNVRKCHILESNGI